MTKSLTRLHNLTRANLVALFVLDPTSRQIRLVEQVGKPALESGYYADVDPQPGARCGRGRPDHAGAGYKRGRRATLPPFVFIGSFRKLSGRARACRLSERYTLFLFFSQPALASAAEVVEAHTAATAAALAAWLERRQFTTQVAGLQRVMLLGQLSRQPDPRGQ